MSEYVGMFFTTHGHISDYGLPLLSHLIRPSPNGLQPLPDKWVSVMS
jgi:hypothetical protein